MIFKFSPSNLTDCMMKFTTEEDVPRKEDEITHCTSYEPNGRARVLTAKNVVLLPLNEGYWRRNTHALIILVVYIHNIYVHTWARTTANMRRSVKVPH